MARPLRIEYPGAVWHVMHRGNDKQDIFRSDGDHLLFESMLEEAVQRFGWILHGFTPMTNHYHLIIETPTMTLSRGMQWLNSKYAQRFNRIHGRCGALYQGRFKSVAVDKETYLLELMRYVALNPVRAGMVERPEDYRWGSYRITAGYAEPRDWVGSSWTLRQFGEDVESQQREYRKFVEAGAHITRSPLEDCVNQIYLGSGQWLQEMRARVESEPRSKEHPGPQRFVGHASIEKVVETVATAFQTTPEEIAARRGGEAREITAWLGCYESMLPLHKIGRVLGLRSASRVSTLIQRCDRRRKQDPLLRNTVDRCREQLLPMRVVENTRHVEQYPGAGPGRRAI
jgi:putative transposase